MLDYRVGTPSWNLSLSQCDGWIKVRITDGRVRMYPLYDNEARSLTAALIAAGYGPSAALNTDAHGEHDWVWSEEPGGIPGVPLSCRRCGSPWLRSVGTECPGKPPVPLHHWLGAAAESVA